jgi:hypothetical protein
MADDNPGARFGLDAPQERPRSPPCPLTRWPQLVHGGRMKLNLWR